jgi:serine-type D-Ala-D-Ala carboxypeptidase (penicillin-binding protein 5/6)
MTMAWWGAVAVGTFRVAGRRPMRIRVWALLLLAATLLWLAPPVLAARPRASGERPAAGRSQAPAKEAAGPGTTSWIVISAATGEEVSSQEPDRPGPPASMTKMMLALLVMEAVKDGQLKLTDPIQASRLASKMGGSQVYLKEGESFSVEEMLAALLIGSANDAAAALAERLGGTIEGAVRLMNERAAALKLTKTRFGSVHGLPPGPGQEGDITTPRDMARLGQELVKFPDVLRWTGTLQAPFRRGSFTLQNSNQMIGHFPGADGIKTGHFREAGYNVAATAKRGNLRLIAVVMGAPTNKARFVEAARLLGEGFARYVEVSVIKAGAPVATELRISRAKGPFRPLAAGDVQVLVKREEKDAIKTSLEIQPDLTAPLAKGQTVGALVVRVGDREVARTPLVTAGAIARKAFWWLTPWK